MAVILSEALRELNIGIHTAVEFLEKRPDLGEIQLDPNFKISDEQYIALDNQFSKEEEFVDRIERASAGDVFSDVWFRGDLDYDVDYDYPYKDGLDERTQKPILREVGFKNFRRFINFPMMNLGGINVFVGKNNAGKSTVMKAAQLFKAMLSKESLGLDVSMFRNEDFYKEDIYLKPTLIFGTDVLNEIHLDNFSTALNRNAERREITISMNVNDTLFDVTLDGTGIIQNDQEVSVPYSCISIKNVNFNVDVDFNQCTCHCSFKPNNSQERIKLINELRQDLENITNERKKQEVYMLALADRVKSADYLEAANLATEKDRIKSVIANLNKKLSELEKEISLLDVDPENIRKEISIQSFKIGTTDDENIFTSILSSILRYRVRIHDLRTKDGKRDKETLQTIKDNYQSLVDIKRIINDALRKFNMTYFHAHSASQRKIFIKGENSDVLSNVLKEYRLLQIDNLVSEEKEFVTRWLNNFDIAKEWKIKNIEDNGYMLKLDGEDLAEKGMGSIQLTTLIIFLAVYLAKLRSDDFIILIEEPEQNIHPMLQAKLADMFEDFYKIVGRRKYEAPFSELRNDIQLIIETHSEYLIRRIMNIVGEKSYIDKETLKKDNPFRVFYFDGDNKEIPCYQMIFETTGNFSNRFGTGFFDAATLLDRDIIARESQTRRRTRK